MTPERKTRIDFRYVRNDDGAYEGGPNLGVEPVIDGEPLSELWSRISGEGGIPVRADLVCWPSHRLWRPDPPPHDELGVGDTRVVLLCVDGLTGCGGATARIIFKEDTVIWRDFRGVPDGERVPLGYFIFDAEQYDRELTKVETKWRTAG